MVISNHSTTAGYQTNEADMQDICELSELLRDAVVEYQVSLNLKVDSQLLEFLPEHWIVCTTEDNIPPELQIDCESLATISEGV